MALSLYIHIPFCKSKCPYCDFTSGFKPEGEFFQDYPGLLIRELELAAEQTSGEKINTIYFGGGTPSLLSPKQLFSILNTIHQFFQLNSIETTLEANPENVTKANAKAWKEMGFDRISLGFQSMEEKVLELLGRRNTPKDNLQAFEILQKAGFENITVDWMASVRGENPDFTLKEILKLEPSHISVYQFTVEEKTLFHQKTAKGEYLPLSDADQMENYWKIADALKDAGYIHYEISNFAKSALTIGKHNKNYWDYGNYLSAGIGAAGFLWDSGRKTGRRWMNEILPKVYQAKIRQGFPPVGPAEDIDLRTAVRESIMLGLRKLEGINTADFKRVFGHEFYSVLPKGKLAKFNDFIFFNDAELRLTRKGIGVANAVIRELWDIINLSGK